MKIRTLSAISLIVISLMLTSCTGNQPNLPPTITPRPTKTTEPPSLSPSPDPLPPNTFGTIDNTTFYGKVVIGYQGWFGCPDDGSLYDRWLHWFEYDNIASIEKLTVDLWPDVSELGEDELCPTGILDAEGNEMFLYSNYHPVTVKRHFLWMAQHGLDGVELQRFATVFPDVKRKLHQERVLENAIAGAEAYGRIFYIQYDGIEKQTLELIKEDWVHLVDDLEITSSPSYLHHKGLPVIGLWGMGFTHCEVSPEEAQDLIDFFHNHPDPKYRATVQGGVPTHWRTLERDSLSDPAWAEVYLSYDIINPWHGNTIGNKAFADIFIQNTFIPDLELTTAYGIDYMPLVFPGNSFHNAKGTGLNINPRQGGTFFWKLATNAISQDVQMIEIAMFDEVDEGTAIYKMVESPNQLPPGEVLIPLNMDGYDLPNDWYLVLAGRITEMLRGERAFTTEIEDLPEPNLEGKELVYLEFTSGANWNFLTYQNPEIIPYIEAISAEGAGTHFRISAEGIQFTQTLESSQAGETMTVNMVFIIFEDAMNDTLRLTLTKGGIGTTELRFFVIREGVEQEVTTITHYLTANDTTGTNPLEINVDLSTIE